MDIQRDVVIYL